NAVLQTEITASTTVRKLWNAMGRRIELFFVIKQLSVIILSRVELLTHHRLRSYTGRICEVLTVAMRRKLWSRVRREGGSADVDSFTTAVAWHHRLRRRRADEDVRCRCPYEIKRCAVGRFANPTR